MFLQAEQFRVTYFLEPDKKALFSAGDVMTHNMSIEKSKKKHHLKIRIALCVGILLFGAGGFIALASLRKPPAEINRAERPLKVKVMAVKLKTVPVIITGYGEVRSLNAVKLSAEVGGQVSAIHPRLEVGEVVGRDALLLEIDRRDYQASVAQSQAEVNQWKAVLNRLKKQAVIDTERLKTLERNRDLAKAEYERINNLLRQHSVGSRSGVDKAEQAYNITLDQADQMGQSVTLYPIRIKEARSSLSGAKARLAQAQANLERCRITAPFDGRITQAAVEMGQYVTPGQTLVTLADDTMLEIQVPLDSRDVRNWLGFEASAHESAGAWFGQPVAVTCNIRWTEDKQGHVWKGTLHRVVAFDQKTRTVTVAVRVDAAAAKSEHSGLPLVAGMFCEVSIPGRDLASAMEVPRAAVSYKNTVFMVSGGRLKTVAVEVARVDNDFAYITSGLKEGDKVIITRLVDPLENTLLEILTD